MPTSLTADMMHLEPAALSGRGILFLAVAGASLLIALRLMRHALAPFGALAQAVAAAAAIALAISISLVLMVAVLIGLG